MTAHSKDLVPALTIIVGGVLGALLATSPLVRGAHSHSVPVAVRYVPVHDAQARVFVSNSGRTYRFRSVTGDAESGGVSPDGPWFAYGAKPLIYIEDVSVGNAFPVRLDPEKVASIEFVNRDAAVELYGEEARAGVYRIALKDGQPPQFLGSRDLRRIIMSAIFALGLFLALR